jgi:hypothetical protein
LALLPVTRAGPIIVAVIAALLSTGDLLRPALEEIIDLGHPLVRLAREIDWGFLDRRFASVCTSDPGQPRLPTAKPCESLSSG